MDLDDEDDGIAHISGANIVTSTPDESVKGTNKDSPSGNLLSFHAVSGDNSNTTKLDDLSLKVNFCKQSNIDVSKLADFMILHNPTVYGSFMQLVGIDNKLVDLEILKSPQVVASYMRFTDIRICTTVTNPLPSQKCSELASELKHKKSDQNKDDSSIKKGFKCIAGDDMEKFLSKKAKKTLEKDKGTEHVSFVLGSPVTRSSSANLKDLAPSKRAAIQKVNAMLKCSKKSPNKIQEQMNILQRCILVTHFSLYECVVPRNWNSYCSGI